MIRFASVTPNLLVRDVARSLAFYRDVLGFTIKESEFYGMREFAVTDPDGHILTFAERVSGE